MAFRQPPQPPFYKKGLLDGSFSIVSTNTPTANATQQSLICDSGQRATAVLIAHHCAQLSDGVAACAIQNRLRPPGELGSSEAGLDRPKIINCDDAGTLVRLVRR